VPHFGPILPEVGFFACSNLDVVVISTKPERTRQRREKPAYSVHDIEQAASKNKRPMHIEVHGSNKTANV
jgi:hypothetical protein